MRDKELRLREFTSSDAAALTLLANNRKLWQNLSDRFPHPYRLEHANAFIDSVLTGASTHTFVVEYQGELAGVIGAILQTDVYRKNIEIGYWIGEKFWGKGLSTCALGLYLEYLRSQDDFHRVFARVFAPNKASMKVLENNGFSLEGISREAAFKDNRFLDVHTFSLLL